MYKPAVHTILVTAAIAIFILTISGCSNRTEIPKELSLNLDDDVKIPLVLIPAGSFLMGSQTSDFDDDKPAHKVTISKPFYMSKYPVTQLQWQALMPTNPSKFKGSNHPVDSVQWKAACEFCTKLSAKTGKPVRLPTEAEWEYACRAGTKTDYYFGNDPNALPDYAWFEKNSNNTTHPVGQKKPNAWGLYDMCGNVWEWCNDWYDQNYIELQSTDPQGPNKSPLDAHVLRGGAWHTTAGYSCSGTRGGDFPCGEGGPASWSNASRSGFRIVVNIPTINN